MKPLIIANWKMNPSSLKEAERLLRETERIAFTFHRNIEMVVCPPFLYLPPASHHPLLYGAQDCFWENPRGGGAYTGEISATMLKQSGARFVIVGHSERRALGETNEIVRNGGNILAKQMP